MLGRAFTLTLFEPIVFLPDLCTAPLYGLLYMWFESSPLVFGGIYGFNIGQQGLVFLGIFVASLTTERLSFRFVCSGMVGRPVQIFTGLFLLHSISSARPGGLVVGLPGVLRSAWALDRFVRSCESYRGYHISRGR